MNMIVGGSRFDEEQMKRRNDEQSKRAAPQPAAHRAGEDLKQKFLNAFQGNATHYGDELTMGMLAETAVEIYQELAAQPPAAGEVAEVLENLGKALYKVDGYQDKLIDPLYAEALQAIEAHYDARFEAALKAATMHCRNVRAVEAAWYAKPNPDKKGD